MGASPNLYSTWDPNRSKISAENLSNTTFEDSSTKLVVVGPKTPTFKIPIPVAISTKICRSTRLKYQLIYNNDNHY